MSEDRWSLCILMNIWENEYKKLLEGKPENTWIPWAKAPIGSEHQEISCVHTSYPHGLLSYGWDGEFKMILYHHSGKLKKEIREKIQTSMWKVAVELARSLNENFPRGIK